MKKGQTLRLYRNKIFNSIKRFFEKIKKSDDLESIKDLILYLIFYGIPINFTMFVIFNYPFTWYSWLGWGVGFWILENKLIQFVRRAIK